MGFFDKIKNYLNEEEDINQEDIEKAHSIVSSKTPNKEEKEESKGLFKRLKRSTKRIKIPIPSKEMMEFLLLRQKSIWKMKEKLFKIFVSS